MTNIEIFNDLHIVDKYELISKFLDKKCELIEYNQTNGLIWFDNGGEINIKDCIDEFGDLSNRSKSFESYIKDPEPKMKLHRDDWHYDNLKFKKIDVTQETKDIFDKNSKKYISNYIRHFILQNDVNKHKFDHISASLYDENGEECINDEEVRYISLLIFINERFFLETFELTDLMRQAYILLYKSYDKHREKQEKLNHG